MLLDGQLLHINVTIVPLAGLLNVAFLYGRKGESVV